jgi:hypothetical protein
LSFVVQKLLLLKSSCFSAMHVYEVRPRKDKRGVDLISDVLPFGRLWYAGPNAVANAIGYAEHRSRSYDAVIRVYDDAPIHPMNGRGFDFAICSEGWKVS